MLYLYESSVVFCFLIHLTAVNIKCVDRVLLQWCICIMGRFVLFMLQSLSFNKIARAITTVDCQPTFDGGVLVNILGQLKVRWEAGLHVASLRIPFSRSSLSLSCIIMPEHSFPLSQVTYFTPFPFCISGVWEDAYSVHSDPSLSVLSSIIS